MLSGEELQLIRLLNRLPPDQSVKSFGVSTTSLLATRLAGLVVMLRVHDQLQVRQWLFVEEALPWLQLIATSDKLTEQAST